MSITRTIRTTAVAAALAAAVLASLVVTAAPAAAAPGEGTVVVTWFEDRYTDGVFNPSLVNPTGQADAKRSGGSYLYLHTADGAWFAAPQNDAGDYVFFDVPVGPAELFVIDPSGSFDTVAFWDATVSTDLERMPQQTVSFANGTFLFPDGTTSNVGGPGIPGGRTAFEIVEGANTPRLIGMAAAGAYAEVSFEDERTSELAELTFLDNGAELAAVEWQPGGYYPSWGGTSLAKLVPGTVGIAVAPDAGYRIATVTARSNVDLTLTFPLTLVGGVWTMNTAALPVYFDSVVFDIVLEVAPVVPTSPPAKPVLAATGGEGSPLLLPMALLLLLAGAVAVTVRAASARR